MSVNPNDLMAEEFPAEQPTEEKSTDEQAPPKEAFVKPSEAQEWTITDESGVGE